MPSSFASLLKPLIAKKFRSQRAFIRAAEPKSNEDGAQSYLSQVLAGKKPPPLDRIEAWADALELLGEEREKFLYLAKVAHLPESEQPEFIRMREHIEKLERNYETLLKQVQERKKR